MASRDGDVTQWSRSGADRSGKDGSSGRSAPFLRLVLTQEPPATESCRSNMDAR